MPEKTFFCSFCGKSQNEVRKLIAGPTVFICNECVDLCAEICTEQSEADNVAMGEAEYLSWDGVAVRPPNSVEVLADALITEMERRGYSITRPRFT